MACGCGVGVGVGVDGITGQDSRIGGTFLCDIKVEIGSGGEKIRFEIIIL